MIIRTLYGILGDQDVSAFTVHEPPDPPADRIDRAEALVFIADGFDIVAAVFGPLWLAVNRMWSALAIYLAVAVALAIVLALAGAPAYWHLIVDASLSLMIGLEADSIRRWSLERRGFEQVGAVVGRNKAECERRFFETWLPGQPMLRAVAPSGAASTPHAAVPAWLARATEPPLAALPHEQPAAALPKPSLLTRFLRGRAPSVRPEK
ncbi:MAG: DUF2628 domain-containing protein [Hyphomicrobiaceae bacterium]|nr:DUF2628 domain-containing protein [Hyphomicrobiaceae bacterium]